MTFVDLTIILGGLAIFLHGLALAREGLQKLAGDRLRSFVTTVTRNRLGGLFAGAAGTVIVQSSTTTTLMLVGFAASGVLSLAQAMAVLLGADIGTTVTVQLLSFRLSHFSLLVAFAGFSLRFLAKKRRLKDLGESVLGFGLLFFGLKLLADGARPLTHEHGFGLAVQYFAANPILGVLVAALLTILLQGSAPAIGLVLALAHAGVRGDVSPGEFQLTLAAALPMVLGANVGTTVPPALSALGQTPEGKRVVVAHVLFKLIGVAVFLPILPWFGGLVEMTSPDLARQVANAHTVFNVFLALAFLPFTSLAAKLLTQFYRPQVEERFGPKYLDPRAIETPPLAFGLATREFMRMCDIVGDMLFDLLKSFEEHDVELIEDIEARDDKVDILNREIRFYLARMALENLTPDQAVRQMTLITLTADIENAGDTINKNLLPMARKMVKSGLQFSEEGGKDIALFHQKVCENFDLAMASFSTSDEELARKVLRHRDGLIQIESELKQKHISRLHQGLQESLDTSGIHLDVFSYLRRVNFLVSNLAEAVVSQKGQAAATARTD